MKRLAIAALLAVSAGGEEARPKPPFDVPEGFEAELVAGPPLVERPIMAAFDDRGRLYVTDSAGVNHRGAELLKDPPHRLRLLEDTDGDGKFDTSKVFADKLVFPQGLLWHQGAVYCVSPPAFWRLEDTDGDGVCDRRSEIVKGFANTGVADDAHGSCLGPDGRVYFLPGRMSHDIKYPDGRAIRKAVGPWLMRCRPDGTDVEIVCGAQGNPVEVDWLPEGDFFISGTFWAPDSYGGGLRDCLVHGVEGGEYAVRDRVYNDRKRTGDFLPAMVPMIATAPSGMTIYRSGAIDPAWRTNLFCTYFNTHKVMRHVLERDGATFRSRNEEFVSSKEADFHPTDVLEDADGSLLVVDTGGWFLIGCPTSKIAKPQVLGGIWRLRRKGQAPVADPRGLKLDWANPSAEWLDDPRFAVRERAIEELAKRGVASIRPALSHASAQARRNAVWAICRIGSGEEVRAALRDPDPGVRQAAVHAVGLHRDAGALIRLEEMVRTEPPHLRREAATALGRLGKSEGVPAILEALRAGGDRFLEHALIYALIRIGAREELVQALRDPNAGVRRAALIALDQMEGGNLTQDLVTPLLDPTDLALQQAALRVITARGWSGEVLGLARQWVASKSPDAATLQGVVVGFARDPKMQDLVAQALRSPETSAEVRRLLLEAMPRGALERLPSTWLAEARWSLQHPDETLVRQAVAVLRSAGVGEFDDVLLALARDEGKSIELRLDVLAAVTARVQKLEGGLFRLLVDNLNPERPPLVRLVAADAIGRATLDNNQLGALANAVLAAGPLELPRLVLPFSRSGDANAGRKLVAALEKSPGLESLTPEAIREALARMPEEVRKSAEPLLKRVSADLEQQRAKLEELKDAAAGGDPARGRQVFLGKKAGCTACHMVSGQGAKVGPDLSKIGSIRTGRDLLEAVVFPSATFARGFEPFRVRTKDGGVHDGLIARETADAIYLFTAERQEKRIARDAVEAILQGKLSIMPQGLDAQLTREELRDLIGFLLSLK
jgi:putative membrane-bound dehydrogenase-like protein